MNIPFITSPSKTITHNDGGEINVFDLNNIDNFSSKRIYYIDSGNLPINRGRHAHKKLEQVMICIKGKCNITIVNQNNQKFEFTLKEDTRPLFLPKLHWREYQLHENSTLLVLASEMYDEKDYIHNFNDFLNFENTIPTNK